MTDNIREEFIKWLKQEIENNKLLIRQMEELKMPSVLIEKLKQESTACIIVHRMLSSLETQTL